MQPVGHRAGHLVHGVLQREHAELAHVAAEHARVAAVDARMRRAGSPHAVGRHRPAVGADHRQRMAEEVAHVVLRADVHHALEPGVLAGYRQNRLHRRLATPGGDLRPHLADHPARRVPVGNGDHVLVPGQRHTAPEPARDLLCHPGARVRVGQPAPDRRRSVLLCPQGQHPGDSACSGGIGIDVVAHVHAPLPRRLHAPHHLAAFAVVPAVDQRDVGVLHGNAGEVTDLDRLVHGVEVVAAMEPGVRGVEGAGEPMSLRRERRDLAGRRRRGRRTGELGGERDRPLLHRLGHQALHQRQLLVVRRPGLRGLRRLPEGAVADLRHHVQADAAAFERLRPAVEVPPRVAHAAAFDDLHRGDLLQLHRGQQPGRERRRSAVSDHLGRHALVSLGFAAGIVEHGDVRMGVHVDEARADHLAAGVDRLAPLGCGQVADRLDSPLRDRHVSPVRRRTGAVDHRSARHHLLECHPDLHRRVAAYTGYPRSHRSGDDTHRPAVLQRHRACGTVEG